MSKKEIAEQAESCFLCKNGNAVLTNPENKDDVHEFGFDFVYGIDTAQQKVFVDFGQPVLQRAFGGYNGTIFAYGQTGSGKTFSMTGVAGHEELEGLIPRMNKALFDHVYAEKTNNPNKLFLVECSFFEIYNEIIYDLLDSSASKDKKNKGLEIKEHSVLGIYVKDLQERVVESREEVLDLMTQGQQNRTVGYTNMNSESSRSHSIFVIKIHQKDSLDESKNVFAKVNLVDLAGSERAAGTGAVGTRLKEGANINKSLSALGNVINALVEDARTGKKSFIPYRNSKLTRVLQESLGGNSLCSMLATLSPANINFIETLGTLKYASRAKSIKVNAKKNEEASQISQLNEEIAALKKRLMEQQSTSVDPLEKNEMIARFEKQIQEMDAVRMQTWEDKAKLSKQHELERKKLAKEKARADQKTQDEKIKKWKLLEAKADIELAIRATRELEIGEDSWISMAAKAKALEQDVKDARTLICVFKDSLDKDVSAWKTNDDIDASSVHVAANQLCTKIKNIQEESAKMMALESELIRQTNTLSDTISNEIDNLHNAWSSTLSTTPTKESKLLYDDRDKALNITLTMVQNYKTSLVITLKSERRRIFNFNDATKLMTSELQSQADSPQMDEDRTKARALALKSLLCALEKCANIEAPKPSALKPEFTPKGELFAFGIEKKIISDDKFTASSGDPKAARLNSNSCWTPTSDEGSSWIKIDLEKPRCIDSLSTQGGIVGGIVAEEAPLDLTKPQMKKVAEQFKPEMVTGDHNQTYDIAKNVMSWFKLLKSNQVPVKLFSRPPVRFLHDVITLVIANTGYGQTLFTDKEKDYAQMPEKKDKSEYLIKVIQLVQTSFQGIVQVKATDANILAGKEPEQTMILLELFCLGAVRFLADTLPDTSEVPLTTTSPQAQQDAWITEYQIELSLDGETWTPLSNTFQGNTDVNSIVITKLPSMSIARHIKLIPTKYQLAPALRLEVTGYATGQTDSILEDVQAEILDYLGLLTKLFSAGELVLDEAKAKWKQAKDSQREKQTALNNLVQEIDSWKAQTLALKAELESANKLIEKWKADKLETDTRLQASNAQVESVTAQVKATDDQLKKAKTNIDALTSQASELTRQNASWKQQHAQLEAQLTSMIQSKEELEKLGENLRAQLTSKCALEGATDSRMASLSAELQSVTIQLDECKRHVQRSDKALAESQSEKDNIMHQLKELKLDCTSKDRQLESIEATFKSQIEELQKQQTSTQTLYQEAINQRSELDSQLQKAVATVSTLQSELETTKKRMSDNANEEIKRLQDEASEAEKRYFAVQTTQVRLKADNDRLETKYAAAEEKLKQLELKLVETTSCIEILQKEKKALEEQEEELTLQLQVVTEERDSARQKEEILFFENTEKDQEIERIRDGYVWVTDRMNSKEDELAELQEQLEKYQSLLRLSSSESPSRPSTSTPNRNELHTLYNLAFGKEYTDDNQNDIMQQLTQWMTKHRNPPSKLIEESKPVPTFVTQPTPPIQPKPPAKPKELESRQASIEDLTEPQVKKLIAAKSIASEIDEDQENDYADDFDAVDEDVKGKRRLTANKAPAPVEPVTAKVLLDQTTNS
ncbi:kinesin [Thraustotheca clavata]|uniref:Kinesin n=1 Tax=Thraustotheca clavata TaxID=74557 RepID=A0A1W0ACN5_9STRA|nr:kinesin [Thraustotheca clavata]